MTTAFHHISLLTKNRHTNLAFYTETLGLRFVKNTVNQDNHRMLHYYYGDYQGTLGTVVTFFVVPHLGNRYDNDHFLATIGLKIPMGSLTYWEKRLKEKGIDVLREETQLHFLDPDQVAITLTEVASDPLPKERQVANEIPGDYQILGLNGTEIHVQEPQKTLTFFKQLLGWQADETGRIVFNETDHLDIIATNTDKKMHMGRGAIDHVAFAVKDETALEALHQKAQRQGWQIEKIVSRGYFKSLYIREPGGNRMEFATLSPGFTIDEPLETLGESFALPPFLADQRAAIEANIYPEE